MRGRQPLLHACCEQSAGRARPAERRRREHQRGRHALAAAHRGDRRGADPPAPVQDDAQARHDRPGHADRGEDVGLVAFPTGQSQRLGRRERGKDGARPAVDDADRPARSRVNSPWCSTNARPSRCQRRAATRARAVERVQPIRSSSVKVYTSTPVRRSKSRARAAALVIMAAACSVFGTTGDETCLLWTTPDQSVISGVCYGVHRVSRSNATQRTGHDSVLDPALTLARVALLDTVSQHMESSGVPRRRVWKGHTSCVVCVPVP